MAWVRGNILLNYLGNVLRDISSAHMIKVRVDRTCVLYRSCNATERKTKEHHDPLADSSPT